MSGTDDSALPPPAPGIVRGTIHSFEMAKGYGYVRLEDGRDVILDVSVRSGLSGNGDRVDLELRTGRDGRLRAALTWPAGQPDPRLAPMATAQPARAREGGIPAEEALRELHENGVLRDVDLAAFESILGAAADGPVDSRHVLGAVVSRVLGGTGEEVLAIEEEAMIVMRELEEAGESKVEAALARLGAFFGAEASVRKGIATTRQEGEDLLDPETLVDLLQSALYRAKRRDRVFLLDAGLGAFAILVRPSLSVGKLRLFGGRGAPAPAAPAPPQQGSPPAPPGGRTAPAANAAGQAGTPATASSARQGISVPGQAPSGAVTAPSPQAVSDAGQRAPAPATTLRLERLETDARQVMFTAQKLADARGHAHVEPLHVAVRIVETAADPARARFALQMAEQSLSRLPRANPGEPSYLSPATLEILRQADLLATGRPVTVADLSRTIRRARGSTAAMVLEAASPD